MFCLGSSLLPRSLSRRWCGGLDMKNSKVRTALNPILLSAAFLLLCGVAIAQSDQVKGVINGRSGATMTVQAQNSENVTVLLSSDTQVIEPEGAFRKKHF